MVFQGFESRIDIVTFAARSRYVVNADRLRIFAQLLMYHCGTSRLPVAHICGNVFGKVSVFCQCGICEVFLRNISCIHAVFRGMQSRMYVGTVVARTRYFVNAEFVW